MLSNPFLGFVNADHANPEEDDLREWSTKRVQGKELVENEKRGEEISIGAPTPATYKEMVLGSPSTITTRALGNGTEERSISENTERWT